MPKSIVRFKHIRNYSGIQLVTALAVELGWPTCSSPSMNGPGGNGMGQMP